jgi:hypothetical protein
MTNPAMSVLIPKQTANMRTARVKREPVAQDSLLKSVFMLLESTSCVDDVHTSHLPTLSKQRSRMGMIITSLEEMERSCM